MLKKELLELGQAAAPGKRDSGRIHRRLGTNVRSGSPGRHSESTLRNTGARPDPETEPSALSPSIHLLTRPLSLHTFGKQGVLPPALVLPVPVTLPLSHVEQNEALRKHVSSPGSEPPTVQFWGSATGY